MRVGLPDERTEESVQAASAENLVRESAERALHSQSDE